MKKIIVLVSDFTIGGVANLIIDLYRNSDRTKFCYVFIKCTHKTNSLDNEIISSGDRIITANLDSTTPANFAGLLRKEKRNIKELTYIFKCEMPVDAIHIHDYCYNSVVAAQKARIPIRIVHSHSSVSEFLGDENKSFLTALRLCYRQYIYKHDATFLIGDSLNASVAMFGNRCKMFRSIYPGIDFKKFDIGRYTIDDTVAQFHVRTEQLNVVHIGRMTAVKNQIFLLSVIRDYVKIYGSSIHLYFVGEGRDKPVIDSFIEENELETYVTLLPATSNIPLLLRGMNCLLLPSISEGFGLVMIEAQLMNVYCLASDRVPRETDIGRCDFLTINQGTEIWTKSMKMLDKEIRHNRVYPLNQDIKMLFDVHEIIKRVENMYEGN